MRTIQSAGVEIREVEHSLTASLPIGTNILVQGFANQGPTDELINVTSMSELEQIYGIPTNAAERYFYHTARRVIESPGNLLATRFPYGSGDGEGYADYSALLFPVSGLSFNESTSAYDTQAPYITAEQYSIGQPYIVKLDGDEYIQWTSGLINWSTEFQEFSSVETPGTDAYNADLIAAARAGKFGMMILNDAKTTINEQREGYYLAMSDNTGLDDENYDHVRNVKFMHPQTGMWATIPESVLEFSLTGDNFTPGDSMSEILEKIATFDEFTSDVYNDSMVLQVYRLRKTLYGSSSVNTLDMVPVESYMGSLDSHRQWTPPTGGVASFWLPGMINENSNYIKMFVNKYIAKEGGSWNGEDGITARKVRVEEPEMRNAFGYSPVVRTSGVATKAIGNVVDKLERSLRLAENPDMVPLDIVVDAGLSTIWTYVNQTEDSNDNPVFNDTDYLKAVSKDDNNDGDFLGASDLNIGSATTHANNWQTITNAFLGFVGEQRKDCIFISDPLRHIFVQGEDAKTLANPRNNFSQHVYRPLRNLYSVVNSNYACTYGNWVKRYDTASGQFVWLPFSGYQANIFANLDSNLYPWFAAAGLNNGIIRDIVDIGFNPSQKHRDLLYKINVNPIVFFPGDGYTVWGQKTLQKKPSAFDRINVRRLFLVLEKATLAIMKYFVFEPNTVFTRTRVTNVLMPIFDIAKNNEGMYDFLIVCDERNNSAQVIDSNEMVVDIYIKPVRIAEFILVNFHATRSSQDFNELI